MMYIVHYCTLIILDRHIICTMVQLMYITFILYRHHMYNDIHYCTRNQGPHTRRQDMFPDYITASFEPLEHRCVCDMHLCVYLPIPAYILVYLYIHAYTYISYAEREISNSYLKICICICIYDMHLCIYLHI